MTDKYIGTFEWFKIRVQVPLIGGGVSRLLQIQSDIKYVCS